jgi:hypothetical protein
MTVKTAADAFAAALVALVTEVVAEAGAGNGDAPKRTRGPNKPKDAAPPDDKDGSKSRDERDTPRAERNRDDERGRDSERGRDDRRGDDSRDTRGRDREDDRRDSRRDERDRDARDDKRVEPMDIKELRAVYGEYLGIEDDKEAKIRGEFAKDVLDHFRVKKISEIDDRDIDEAYEYLVAHKRGDKVRFRR